MGLWIYGTKTLNGKAAECWSKGGIAVTSYCECFHRHRMNGNFHFHVIYLHLIPMEVTWGILETI